MAQVQQSTQGRHEGSLPLYPHQTKDRRHAIQHCSEFQGMQHRLLRSELQAKVLVEVVALLRRVRWQLPGALVPREKPSSRIQYGIKSCNTFECKGDEVCKYYGCKGHENYGDAVL